MARRHHINRSTIEIFPDRWDSNFIDKSERTVFHFVQVMPDTLGGVTGLSHKDYDDFDTSINDMDDMPYGDWVNARYLPGQNQNFPGAYGTYKTVVMDEIEMFAEPIRIRPGLNYSNSGWLQRYDFRKHSDIERPQFFNQAMGGVSMREIDRLYGGWFLAGDADLRRLMQKNNLRLYSTREGFSNTNQNNNPNRIDNTEDWYLVYLGQLLQLMGELPRNNADWKEDFKDFFFISKEEDYVSGGIIGSELKDLLNRQNISKVSFVPSGIMRGSTPANAKSRPCDTPVGNFGESFALMVDGIKGLDNPMLFNVGGANPNSDPGTIPFIYPNSITIPHNHNGFGGQIRYARTKTADELGYRLVADSSLNKVTFEAPDWVNPDSGRYVELDNTVSIDMALCRGVALRYANREHRVVLKSWAAIQAEANEIKEYLTIL